MAGGSSWGNSSRLSVRGLLPQPYPTFSEKPHVLVAVCLVLQPFSWPGWWHTPHISAHSLCRNQLVIPTKSVSLLPCLLQASGRWPQVMYPENSLGMGSEMNFVL